MNLYMERHYSKTTADPTYNFIRNNAAKTAAQVSSTPAVFTSAAKSESLCTSRSWNSSRGYKIIQDSFLLQNPNRNNSNNIIVKQCQYFDFHSTIFSHYFLLRKNRTRDVVNYKFQCACAQRGTNYQKPSTEVWWEPCRSLCLSITVNPVG